MDQKMGMAVLAIICGIILLVLLLRKRAQIILNFLVRTVLGAIMILLVNDILHIFAWTFVRSGTRSSAKATAPDTRGAAIEVPLFTTYSFLLLPGAQEMRRFPGATRSGLQTQSRVGPHPEIPLLGSSRSPAPTVINKIIFIIII